jgi:hypothetical protein
MERKRERNEARDGDSQTVMPGDCGVLPCVLPDEDRLHTDVVGDIRKKCDERVVHEQQKVVVNRAVRMQRDEARWSAMEQRTVKEEVKWENIRADESNTLARRGKTRYGRIVYRT